MVFVGRLCNSMGASAVQDQSMLPWPLLSPTLAATFFRSSFLLHKPREGVVNGQLAIGALPIGPTCLYWAHGAVRLSSIFSTWSSFVGPTCISTSIMHVSAKQALWQASAECMPVPACNNHSRTCVLLPKFLTHGVRHPIKPA